MAKDFEPVTGPSASSFYGEALSKGRRLVLIRLPKALHAEDLQGLKLKWKRGSTGTMHLAAALGVPTVSLFGSTEPVLTGPVGDRHRVLRHHVPCSPCFKRECPFGHYDCMTGLTPARVAAALREALAEPV